VGSVPAPPTQGAGLGAGGVGPVSPQAPARDPHPPHPPFALQPPLEPPRERAGPPAPGHAGTAPGARWARPHTLRTRKAHPYMPNARLAHAKHTLSTLCTLNAYLVQAGVHKHVCTCQAHAKHRVHAKYILCASWRGISNPHTLSTPIHAKHMSGASWCVLSTAPYTLSTC